MIRRAIAALVLVLTQDASAMTRIASDGRVTLSELELLVEPNTWTVRVRLEGSARRVALLFPLPSDDPSAQVGEPSLLDRIDYATAPRVKVADAADPCAGPAAQVVVTEAWPERKSPPAPGFTARVIAPQGEAQLAALLPGLTLDAESRTALARLVRGGHRIVVLEGPAPGKLRGFWTPPLVIEHAGRSIPIGLAAPHVSVGKELHVDLYVKGSLAPKQKTADLPSEIALPEVTFEAPLDAFRSMCSQTIRREGRGTAVRIHSKEYTRWYLEVGRKDDRAVIELEDRELFPFAGVWLIRRVWRKPIGCAEKTRYLNGVSLQQKAEIQTYAASTGRPQRIIETAMRERGYLIEDGQLRPIQIRAP